MQTAARSRSASNWRYASPRHHKSLLAFSTPSTSPSSSMPRDRNATPRWCSRNARRNNSAEGAEAAVPPGACTPAASSARRRCTADCACFVNVGPRNHDRFSVCRRQGVSAPVWHNRQAQVTQESGVAGTRSSNQLSSSAPLALSEETDGNCLRQAATQTRARRHWQTELRHVRACSCNPRGIAISSSSHRHTHAPISATPHADSMSAGGLPQRCCRGLPQRRGASASVIARDLAPTAAAPNSLCLPRTVEITTVVRTCITRNNSFLKSDGAQS